ncbi:MAG: Endo-type membrane-bound lytic murein transglycosylase A [Myxococcota bacterium]|nr:Endo-type membrane-bound lytic murein transglycosylase A [Myxococcota bacterium]
MDDAAPPVSPKSMSDQPPSDRLVSRPARSLRLSLWFALPYGALLFLILGSGISGFIQDYQRSPVSQAGWAAHCMARDALLDMDAFASGLMDESIRRLRATGPDPRDSEWMELRNLLMGRHSHLDEDTAGLYSRLILDNSRAWNLDPLLLAALIEVESRFRSGALSNRGAIGLMQLRLTTAQETASRLNLGEVQAEDLTRPELNIALGGRYLRKLIRRNGGELAWALEAYNRGPEVVRGIREQGDDPPPEFWSFSDTVLRKYRHFSELRRLWDISSADMVARSR